MRIQRPINIQQEAGDRRAAENKGISKALEARILQDERKC
jgi:hypothetical protein